MSPQANTFTPQQLLDGARRAVADGRVDIAEAMLHQIIGNAPLSPEAMSANGELQQIANIRRAQAPPSRPHQTEPSFQVPQAPAQGQPMHQAHQLAAQHVQHAQHHQPQPQLQQAVHQQHAPVQHQAARPPEYYPAFAQPPAAQPPAPQAWAPQPVYQHPAAPELSHTGYDSREQLPQMIAPQGRDRAQAPAAEIVEEGAQNVPRYRLGRFLGKLATFGGGLMFFGGLLVGLASIAVQLKMKLPIPGLAALAQMSATQMLSSAVLLMIAGQVARAIFDTAAAQRAAADAIQSGR